MMWSYRNCYYLSFGYVAFLAACLIINSLGIRYSRVVSDMVWFVDTVYGGVVIYSLIALLRTFGENKWRLFAFHLFLVVKIIGTIADVIMARTLSISIIQYSEAFIGLVLVAATISLIVSIFRIKKAPLRFYLRVYAYAMIIVFLYSFFSPMMLGLLEESPSVFRLNNHIRAGVAILPYLAILMLYWKLYDENFRFRVNDLIIVKCEYDNVPLGSKGVVIIKHEHSDYYDIEFFDDKDNLLNTLTVPSKDIEHAPMADLQSRIETFGI